MLLGILAMYLNKTTGKKVLVVVPTAFLHLYQEKHYCPIASKIPDNICNAEAKDIFYCTFEQFLQPNFAVPSETIVLVDEFHELIFNCPV